MKNSVTTILEVLAISAGIAFVACSGDEDTVPTPANTAGTSSAGTSAAGTSAGTSSAGTNAGGQAGCPAAGSGGQAGCPAAGAGGQAGCPAAGSGGQAGCPAAGAGGQAGCPAAGAGGQAGCPAAGSGGQAGCPAAGAGGQAGCPAAGAGGQAGCPAAGTGGQAGCPAAGAGGQAGCPAAGTGGQAGCPSAEAVPTSNPDLLDYLTAGKYKGFASESAPHAQTNGSPHTTTVKVFVNDALNKSLAAGNAKHPVGSAAVKELYDSAGKANGWAVGVKVDNKGVADDWYWYEKIGASVVYDGKGGFCGSCHGQAQYKDNFASTYPLK